MRSFAALTATLTLALAVAASALTPAQVRKQDTTAQANVAHLLSLITSCYATTDDFTQCQTVAQLTHGGRIHIKFPLVDGVPQARSGSVGISQMSTVGYQLTSASLAGVTYRFTVSPTWAVKTTCTPAGRAACPASGHWTTGAVSLVYTQHKHRNALRQTGDARAKADVLKLSDIVEACQAHTDDYSQCMTIAQLPAAHSKGLPLVDGTPAAKSGQVGVSSASKVGYVLTAVSTTGIDFVLVRLADGSIQHACAAPAGADSRCAGPGW